MSVADRRLEASEALSTYPTFDLTYLFDDADDPTAVTVFSPDEGDVTTHWITIDVEAAVPIEAAR